MELSEFEIFIINSSLEKFFKNNYKELSSFAVDHLKNIAINEFPSELEAIEFREENITIDQFFHENSNTSYFRTLVKEWCEFETIKKLEFLAAIESCKHLLIERKSIVPQKEFWPDFYYSWFLKKQEIDASKVSIYELQKLIKNTPSDIIDWISEFSAI
jgi:sulfatase maturation enzyme AslB (radical SAM superfamily)